MKSSRKLDRRNFIKQGTQVAALSTLMPVAINRTIMPGGEQKKDLLYRTLGKTGIKVPLISMGTGDTDNPNLVKAALDAGVTLLATSQYYGNGNNETMLGEIIKERDRNSVILMTSANPGGVNYKEGLFTGETKAEPFLEKCNGSLKRLGVECIDIFLLPFAARRESVFFEPLLKAMELIKKQGKAKYIGIATHSYEEEAIVAAADTGIYDIIMTAYNFRRKNISEIDKALEYATGKGLGIIAMKTMAGIYWDKEKTLPINTKASLKWALQNENIHTAVPGATTFEQLKDDISIMSDPELTEQEKDDLKLASGDNRHGLYCQQCGKCIRQCPEKFDIPTLMRSYMYAYGYGDFKKARRTLDMVQSNTIPCQNCDVCNIKCSMGFDIKSKATDIIRLRDVPDEFLA